MKQYELSGFVGFSIVVTYLKNKFPVQIPVVPNYFKHYSMTSIFHTVWCCYFRHETVNYQALLAWMNFHKFSINEKVFNRPSIDLLIKTGNKNWSALLNQSIQRSKLIFIITEQAEAAIPSNYFCTTEFCDSLDHQKTCLAHQQRQSRSHRQVTSLRALRLWLSVKSP